MRTFLAALVLVVVPELIRALNEERARVNARDEAERHRAYDCREREKDRENALKVASISKEVSDGSR